VETLTRERILTALRRLDALLGESDRRAALYLVGGAVMCLVLDARDSTRDVDAWFSEPQLVREAARRVAAELDLPQDWLNDAATAYLPEGAGFERWGEFSHMDVLVADERTLFAMKCAAARTAEDVDDIRLLASRLGLTTAKAALDIVLRYYPEDRLPVRTRLLLEELLGGGP
jgi:hypothetical protein